MVFGNRAAQKNVDGHIGGVGAQLRVVHAAGGEGTGGDEGVCARVVGDTGLVQDLSHGRGCSHDHIVRGGEDGLHPAHHGGSGGENFIGGVAGLFQIGNALAVQVFLGLPDGGHGVCLAVGVQQSHGFNVGICFQHHVQNEGGVQCIRGAGDVGNARQLGFPRIGDGGVDHRNLIVLGGRSHGGGSQSGNGNDGIVAVGDHLGADLVQNGGIVLAVEILIGNGNALFCSLGLQLGLNGHPDLIQ